MNALSLFAELRTRFSEAVAQVAGAPPVDPLVRPSADAKFGDYQCNIAMSLAKTLGAKPRDVAERVKAAAAPLLSDLAEPLEIAGAGFINIRLKNAAMLARLRAIEPMAAATAAVDRCGIPPATAPQHVLVDYSSPNIAKQMHVGHLRSTIIGDVFVRALGFFGHTVTRQNHVGDWGTAIGMVVLGYWYVQMRFRRGESAAQIEERIRAFAVPKNEPLDRLNALGRQICDEWSDDLQDPAFDRFSEESFGAQRIGLDELELGYRFVQALIAIAQRLDWRVRNRQPSASAEGETEWERIANIPRKVTRMLQLGGARNEPERRAWQQARHISLAECQGVYDRLGVMLTERDVCGESFYEQGERLPRVVAELREKLGGAGRCSPDGTRAVFRTDAGAECVFLEQADGQPTYKTPEGQPQPLIVRKSDGAYLYATTDLAAVRYRIEELGARRLIYVTDARQKQHFEMFFRVARIVGWACHEVSLEHTTFGSVLGEDKKPLKTRDGRNIKLRELLDEAARRAFAVIQERRAAVDADGPSTVATAQERPVVPVAPAIADSAAADALDAGVGEGASAEESDAEIARIVGIGAVKYADLSRDRNTDYVFSWDKMLALQGNTAPYMLYAYARVRSIYRKAAATAGIAAQQVYASDLALAELAPAERALALRLCRLHETLETLAADLQPHVLCAYLYDLAADFMRFYESCPVLAAESESTRLARLRLCDLTARALRLGLHLLGIETLERM